MNTIDEKFIKEAINLLKELREVQEDYLHDAIRGMAALKAYPLKEPVDFTVQYSDWHLEEEKGFQIRYYS